MAQEHQSPECEAAKCPLGDFGSKGVCYEEAQHALEEFSAVLAGGVRGGRRGGARVRGSTASPDRSPADDDANGDGGERCEHPSTPFVSNDSRSEMLCPMGGVAPGINLDAPVAGVDDSQAAMKHGDATVDDAPFNVASEQVPVGASPRVEAKCGAGTFGEDERRIFAEVRDAISKCSVSRGVSAQAAWRHAAFMLADAAPVAKASKQAEAVFRELADSLARLSPHYG